MKQLKSSYDINDTVNYCIASVPCKFQLGSLLAGVELHHITPDTRGLLALLTCWHGATGDHHHPDTRHHNRRNPPSRTGTQWTWTFLTDNIEACYGSWCGLRGEVMTSSHDIMTRVTRGNWRRRVWHGGRDDNICTGSPSAGQEHPVTTSPSYYSIFVASSGFYQEEWVMKFRVLIIQKNTRSV